MVRCSRSHTVGKILNFWYSSTTALQSLKGIQTPDSPVESTVHVGRSKFKVFFLVNEDGKWNLMDNKLLLFLPAAINRQLILIMITKGNINTRRLIAIIIFVKLRTFALPLSCFSYFETFAWWPRKWSNTIDKGMYNRQLNLLNILLIEMFKLWSLLQCKIGIFINN